MYTVIIIVFILGYLAIALESKLDINKTAIALLLGVVCWVMLMIGRTTLFPNIGNEVALEHISESLLMKIGEISEILFFLLGAMTIVELIDAHQGFSIVTDRIKITNRVKLIWILSFLTFFLSAILDNLTTSIVMATLLKKLMKDKNDLWLFAGVIIIAANAGGAWSPIGDVTTIMLWIGGQITSANIIFELFLPSVACLIVPLIFLSFKLKGNIESNRLFIGSIHNNENEVSNFDKVLVFCVGVGALLFVPFFKTITHLPPFMGILFGLSVLWILTEILHRNKKIEEKASLSIVEIIQRIDTPSILFFLGILMAVGALEHSGHLMQLSNVLSKNFDNIYIVNGLIGVLSSIIDNVPMVAGAMGMYSLETYPTDHMFWELLAYCAGTGGSILIIGSAAGVAIMGIFKIDFIWYLKKISLLAILGFLAGMVTYFIFN